MIGKVLTRELQDPQGPERQFLQNLYEKKLTYPLTPRDYQAACDLEELGLALREVVFDYGVNPRFEVGLTAKGLRVCIGLFGIQGKK